MWSLWVNKQCVCRLVTQSLSCPSVRLRCCWADFFFIFKVRNNSKDLIVSFLLKRKYANLLAETWLVQEYNWNDLKLKNNNKITLNFSILIIKTKYLWVCSWRRRKCLIWERSCWFKAGMRAGAERQSAAPIRWESQVFFFSLTGSDWSAVFLLLQMFTVDHLSWNTFKAACCCLLFFFLFLPLCCWWWWERVIEW